MRSAVAIAALTFLAPDIVWACGGLFCRISPVDQNAERILFEVHPDDRISVHVEISYSGDPEAFSWVIPVAQAPAIETIPSSALRLLDAATAPRFISPPTTCGGSRGFGLADSTSVANGENSASPVVTGGVTVTDLPNVGPFDPEVVEASDPQLLIRWLRDNDYTVTPEMEPLIASYVNNRMKFLGMKLLPGAGVNHIAPIKMTFDGKLPAIPLVLTAVASEPEMGVVVVIAAARRYRSLNWHNLEIDRDRVHVNPATGQNNYFPLVSWLIDEAGGRGFITQAAMSTEAAHIELDRTFMFTQDGEESRAFVKDLYDRQPYVTRLYARASGWEMLEDPMFGPGGEGDVDRTFDLSDRPEVELCGERAPRVPCGDTYCGEGALCGVTTDGDEGCVCGEGQLARVVNVPGDFGTRETFCQRDDFDMLASLADDPTIADPCDGLDCGAGTCEVRSGIGTCRCDAGFTAIVNGAAPRCEKTERTFGPEALLWTDPGCSCRAGAGVPWSAAPVVLMWLWSRRRRRRG